MQAQHAVSHPELRRPARKQFLASLAICALLAAAVLGGVALAQSGRSGPATSPSASAPAQVSAEPIRPSARLPGEPSLLGGYLVFDWDGPIPGFDE